MDNSSKFSYSRLNVYENCSWRYKLQYEDGHYIDSTSIANEFGTILHHTEDILAKDIQNNSFDNSFDKYINIFIKGDASNNFFGVSALKKKYPSEFDQIDKTGLSYDDKANYYLNYGIYRLYDYLKNNPNIKILGTEVSFSLTYKNYKFQGFIDRILLDQESNNIIVEDIKTWSHYDENQLKTPLQFVIYVEAIKSMYNITEDNIKCFYNLPLLNQTLAAGSKGFIKRGLRKIDSILESIENKNFKPKPGPLCHWCVFSKTFPNQPESAKNLCPYCSNWTPSFKNNTCDFEWLGIENHENVLADFISKSKNNNDSISINKIRLIPDRILLFRNKQ